VRGDRGGYAMRGKKPRNRVLFISDHFFPESFLGNEIPSCLRRQGYAVDVLTQNPAYPEGVIYPGNPNPLFRLTRMDGIRVIRLKTITGYRDSLARKIANYLWFMLASTFYVVLSIRSYDFLFVYHVGTLTEAIPLYVAKRVFRRRTSIWTLDIWPDSVFSFGFRRTPLVAAALDRFVSAIYRSCDAIMVGSPGFVEKIGRFVPRGRKPEFIPQWAPRQLFEEEDPPVELERDAVNFVFAGNIGTQQNLDRVIRAFAFVERDGGPAHLHVVGDGRSLECAKTTASRLGATCVHFHPRIPQEQVLRLLRSADACVLSLNPDPSIELTLPAKFQTYLHSGRPILCVSRGEAKTLVETHGLGEIADPGSIDSIVSAIGRMCGYSDRDKAGIAVRMSALATEAFREETSLRKIVRGITGAPA
jgi:glycosyltransferase involved in cell wall biosynthesis